MLILFSILMLTSCQNDNNTCIIQAYKIPSSQVIFGFNESNSYLGRESSNLSLTEDTVIEGDKTISGDLNLNGYTLRVNGNLFVNNNINGQGSLYVKQNISVSGNLQPNGGEITSEQGSISVSGYLNGPGTITYCVQLAVSAAIQNNPIVIQDCGETLSTPSFGSVEMVPCDYIGQEIDGYKYINID